jgi:hypothetical protein
MATLTAPFVDRMEQPRGQSGSPLARAIDRWIYVFTAASFIAIVLTGFIPDSIGKIAAVQAGDRPPFPLVLHMHAILMGSFLLVLLAQTTLAAIGRNDLHRRLGIAGIVIGSALVVAGFILAPTMYHLAWNAAQTASPEMREELQQGILGRDNIMLFQLRIGILFPILLYIGVRARGRNAGLHKRMMILATVMALPAGIDRISWLPTTLPGSPLATDFYTLMAVSPMFLWDVARNGAVHKAYWIWLGIALPFTVAVHGLWSTAWWQSIAPRVMGV